MAERRQHSTAKKTRSPAASARAVAAVSPTPRAYHHGDLAKALVQVSLEMVEKEGVEAFSLREAATRCGVAVSAAYKHYASKGELLHAVADRGFAAMADGMEQAMARAASGQCGLAAAEARLVALGSAYVHYAAAHPGLFRLMFGPLGPRGGRGDPRPDAPAHRLSTLLVGCLAEVARERGRDDQNQETNKLAAWSIVHGFSMMVVDGVFELPSEAALHAVTAALGQAILRSLP